MLEEKKQRGIILANFPQMVSLEGIDGCGKSTQIRNLLSILDKEGVKVAVYPYTSKNNFWGHIINAMYSKRPHKRFRESKSIPQLQELLYALSARANFRKISLQAKKSDLLISDRSIITAYASHIDEIPWWFIDLVELRMLPDVVIYLDVPASVAIERICNRSIRYADETLSELIYFSQCYKRIIDGERPKSLSQIKFVTVNGLKRESDITDEIYQVIRKEVMLGGRR